MQGKRAILILSVAVASILASYSHPQQQKKATPKTTPIAPAEKLGAGWEKIDKRLVFLMVRLADVEAGLDAIDKKVAGKKGQRSTKVGEAKKAEKGNEIMDRKGGGPMKWSEFYGTTAEKFFYHPVDQNTTYHTQTILSQQSPQADFPSGEGVPSRQGVPVHQRPPQFDYIYRANQDAQARAERQVQDLGQKIDALLARRIKLEAEQTMLWCQIAFRAVSRHDLVKKPLYRFEPQPIDPGTEAQDRADGLKAAVVFVRTSLSIIEVGEQDQGKAFGAVKKSISDGRERVDDVFLQKHILSGSPADLKTPAGRFAALSKHLEDEADNLSDSYQVAIEGDQAQDQVRKDTFRRLLQESLVNYAQTVLALDEMSGVMASEWKVKPDLNTPIVLANLILPHSPSVAPGNISKDTSDVRVARARGTDVKSTPTKGGWTALFGDMNQFRENWKPGDNRGNVYFDPKAKSIAIDGPYDLGTIMSKSEWKELEFVVSIETLSFGNFRLQINNITLNIGPALRNPGVNVVHVRYDPDQSLAAAFVGDRLVSRATILDEKWASSLSCELHSGGGGNAKLQLSNVRLTNERDTVETGSSLYGPKAKSSARPEGAASPTTKTVENPVDVPAVATNARLRIVVEMSAIGSGKVTVGRPSDVPDDVAEGKPVTLASLPNASTVLQDDGSYAVTYDFRKTNAVNEFISAGWVGDLRLDQRQGILLLVPKPRKEELAKGKYMAGFTMNCMARFPLRLSFDIHRWEQKGSLEVTLTRNSPADFQVYPVFGFTGIDGLKSKVQVWVRSSRRQGRNYATHEIQQSISERTVSLSSPSEFGFSLPERWVSGDDTCYPILFGLGPLPGPLSISRLELVGPAFSEPK